MNTIKPLILKFIGITLTSILLASTVDVHAQPSLNSAELATTVDDGFTIAALMSGEWPGRKSVIAINEFRAGELYEIRLHPIELGYSEVKLARRGIPVIASPEVSQRILRRLQALSQPLGTSIVIENNLGIIRPSTQ